MFSDHVTRGEETAESPGAVPGQGPPLTTSRPSGRTPHSAEAAVGWTRGRAVRPGDTVSDPSVPEARRGRVTGVTSCAAGSGDALTCLRKV